MMNFYTFLVLNFSKIIWTINPCKYLLLIWCHLNKNMLNLEVPRSTLRTHPLSKNILNLEFPGSTLWTHKHWQNETLKDRYMFIFLESFYDIPIGMHDTRRIKNSYKIHIHMLISIMLWLYQRFSGLFVFKEIKEKPKLYLVNAEITQLGGKKKQNILFQNNLARHLTKSYFDIIKIKKSLTTEMNHI